MKKKGKYDLVYVPAESYMLATADDDTVRSFIKLKKHLRGIYDQT